MGSDPGETAALMEAVRPLTDKPLIVKLTPNTADVGAVAEAAERGGAAALSLINTLVGMAVDPDTGRPWLGAGTGGLSGPAIRPVALAMTNDVAARVSVPVIGMGGISSGRDALDFIEAGASCIAVGTESFRDPSAGRRVLDELERLLAKRGFRSARDALVALSSRREIR
jgi:dihydroorotate dehydrogenase (NAD+) catalytic subunit